MTDTLMAIATKDGHAFGILSEPDTPSRVAAVVLPGANDFANAGPFLHTLSLALAGAGITSLRVDYLDFGESSGGIAYLEEDEPRLDEVTAAVAVLKERGHSEIVLIGFCYGGRVALAAARLGGIVGEVLMSPPSRLPRLPGTTWTSGHFLRRVVRPRNWLGLLKPANREFYARVARRFVRGRRVRQSTMPARTGRAVSPNLMLGIERLQRLGIPALVLFGEQDETMDFLRSEAAALPNIAALLAGELSSIDTVILQGSVHQIRGDRTAELTIQCVVEWTQGISGVASSPGVDGVSEQRHG